MLGWYAAAVDGLYDGLPLVRAEPGGRDACICDVEDGDGEGFEVRRWRDGEVYDLDSKQGLA